MPADPAIASIALGVATLAFGRSRLLLRAVPEPVDALTGALRRLGVSIARTEDALEVEGRGLDGLEPPDEVLDARGMPLAASILMGLLAGRPFEAQLVVDDEVADRLVPALEASFGVSSRPWSGGGQLLAFHPPAERPRGIQAMLPGCDPAPKVALLLAGLRAQSPTTLDEAIASPDHCERLLQHLEMPLTGSATTRQLHPPRDPKAIRAFELPEVGDFSAAAYLLAAAVLVPESHVTVRGVGLNPTRTGLLDAFRFLGAHAGITPQGDVLCEPFGEVTAMGRGIVGGALAGETAARMGADYVPATIALARATQPVEVADIGAGSDEPMRAVARLVGVLRAYGVDAAPSEGGLVLRPAMGPTRATRVTTGGDHRLALAATLLGLSSDGPSVVDDVDCLRRFFPRVVGTLRALGATIEVKSDERQ